MIKEIIKPLIIGISIIVGVLIYTEQTKYEIIDGDTTNENLNYFLLNKKNGEVISIINISGSIKIVKTPPHSL